MAAWFGQRWSSRWSRHRIYDERHEHEIDEKYSFLFSSRRPIESFERSIFFVYFLSHSLINMLVSRWRETCENWIDAWLFFFFFVSHGPTVGHRSSRHTSGNRRKSLAATIQRTACRAELKRRPEKKQQHEFATMTVERRKSQAGVQMIRTYEEVGKKYATRCMCFLFVNTERNKNLLDIQTNAVIYSFFLVVFFLLRLFYEQNIYDSKTAKQFYAYLHLTLNCCLEWYMTRWRESSSSSSFRSWWVRSVDHHPSCFVVRPGNDSSKMDVSRVMNIPTWNERTQKGTEEKTREGNRTLFSSGPPFLPLSFSFFSLCLLLYMYAHKRIMFVRSFVLSFILHIILWCYTHTHVLLHANVRLYNYNSIVVVVVATVVISMFTLNVRPCQAKRVGSIQKTNERKRSDVEWISLLLLSRIDKGVIVIDHVRRKGAKD